MPEISDALIAIGSLKVSTLKEISTRKARIDPAVAAKLMSSLPAIFINFDEAGVDSGDGKMCTIDVLAQLTSLNVARCSAAILQSLTKIPTHIVELNAAELCVDVAGFDLFASLNYALSSLNGPIALRHINVAQVVAQDLMNFQGFLRSVLTSPLIKLTSLNISGNQWDFTHPTHNHSPFTCYTWLVCNAKLSTICIYMCVCISNMLLIRL